MRNASSVLFRIFLSLITSELEGLFICLRTVCSTASTSEKGQSHNSTFPPQFSHPELRGHPRWCPWGRAWMRGAGVFIPGLQDPTPSRMPSPDSSSALSTRPQPTLRSTLTLPSGAHMHFFSC